MEELAGSEENYLYAHSNPDIALLYVHSNLQYVLRVAVN
jgi:hypothetical protein